MYYVYIVRCSDESFYTGITNDLNKRLQEHNFGNKGAKYTKAKRPVKLVYFATFANRSGASKEEWRIKNLSRIQKSQLVTNFDIDLAHINPLNIQN
jgi:putative endonuclease